jgi:hypothetical protein
MAFWGIGLDELLERVRSVDAGLRGPERDAPTAWPASRAAALKPDGDVERYEVCGEDVTVCLTVAAKPSPDKPVPDYMGPVSFDLRAEVTDEDCMR